MKAAVGVALLSSTLLLGSCDSGLTPSSQARRMAGDGARRALTGSLAFVNFELGAAPGTTCPGAPGCVNGAAEPAIRADPMGSFYVGSELGLGAGTLAWKSTDGGQHYTALVSPDQVSQLAGGIAPGGGDVDVGVATAVNATGTYNVYVATLSLANVTVSTSGDGGQTWSKNALSATVPVDDREWIAADGASKVCVSYHDIATFNIDVNCSVDAGTTFIQPGSAIDPAHLFLLNDNSTGNLVIDQTTHVIYQTFSGIANAMEAVGTSSHFHAVWMAVSQDGGHTFTDYPVYINPNAAVDYGHQFINATVDQAGTVYAVYNDNHNLFYSFSTDQGRTWSAPVQVNQAPSATAVMPWSVACAPGELNIVWYGTSFYDGQTIPDNYPSSAAWFVYFAQNLNATSGGSFTQVAATPVIHFGGVCESGVTCSGNRDLFDDFGISVAPATGLASITFSDDQPGNTSGDDHTAIATQTGGPGICGP
ncbi:MAG TPA: hypothetical protein VH113_05040 [Gemmatimonadales bacterium]|jgi:hypothetical protein|nr:hypothetical protein [Gemmatimonadales bacterium]